MAFDHCLLDAESAYYKPQFSYAHPGNKSAEIKEGKEEAEQRDEMAETEKR